MITIDTNIQGIPCQIQLDRCFVQKPLGPYCDSDWDASGYTEIDFTVLDRRGYPAPWLERKLTTDDTCRIQNALLEASTP